MDVSDYLKSGFQMFHKTQGIGFGKSLSVATRSQQLMAHRKSNRNKLMLERRLIDEETMSPYKTPKVTDKLNQKLIKDQEQTMKRIEMLKKWKAEKQTKLKEEKKKQKPLFKVTHVQVNIGKADLENINKVIKGKPFKSDFTVQKKKLDAKYNFAPKNYQFKGPLTAQTNNHKKVNVVTSPKRVQVNENVSSKRTRKVQISDERTTPKKQPMVYKKTPAKANSKQLKNINNKENETLTNHRTYELRSRNISIPNNKPLIENLIDNTNKTEINTKSRNDKTAILERPKVKGKLRRQSNVKSTSREENEETVKHNRLNSSSSETSVDYPIGECINTPPSDSLLQNTPKPKDQLKTPDVKRASVAYISPFVTVSRGKDSARKEFHHRKSKGGLFDSSPDIRTSTGPQAGAAYFRRILDQEISRIEGLCEEWNLYKEEQSPPEEACDLINVAVGQSKLLLQKKFKQFKDLIDSCESKNSDMPITCEDLHGYWDTAYIQVDNLYRRFNNLSSMRANNWKEIVPEVKKGVIKKSGVVKPKVQATSRLKDAIRAAKNKAKLKSDVKDDINGKAFDGVFFAIESPKKTENIQVKTPTKKRQSLLIDVLSKKSEARGSSPGLVMLKASQMARSLEKRNESTMTPGKSILKSLRSKSSVKKSKSVLFKENDNVNSNNSCEKIISVSPEEVPDERRRSLRTRLTRSKLF